MSGGRDDIAPPETDPAPEPGAAPDRRDPRRPPRKAPRRLPKWEPYAAMGLVLALGVWLVAGPLKYVGVPERREGAVLQDLRIGPVRGLVEIVRAERPVEAEAPSFRLLFRDGTATDVLPADEFADRFGEPVLDEVLAVGDNPLFKLFNITSWASLAWIAIGLGGQCLFFGRMAVQWVLSEKRRSSVVPPVFWYLSLGGGVLLFTYFVWRQDFVGVLGQTSGVVIYARNIRLIRKEKRRERRRASFEAAAAERVREGREGDGKSSN